MSTRFSLSTKSPLQFDVHSGGSDSILNRSDPKVKHYPTGPWGEIHETPICGARLQAYRVDAHNPYASVDGNETTELPPPESTQTDADEM